MTNIAACHADMGQGEEALSMKREMYAKAEACDFPPDIRLSLAGNLANGLIKLGHHVEAKTFLRRIIPTALSTEGPNNIRVLYLRGLLGQALLRNAESRSSPELDEAEKVLTDVYARKRRVCGASHPDTLHTQSNLEIVRKAIALRAKTSK